MREIMEVVNFGFADTAVFSVIATTTRSARARRRDGHALGGETGSCLDFRGEFVVHLGDELFNLAASDARKTQVDFWQSVCIFVVAPMTPGPELESKETHVFRRFSLS